MHPAVKAFLAAALLFFGGISLVRADDLVVQDRSGAPLLSFKQSDAGVEVAIQAEGRTIVLKGSGSTGKRRWETDDHSFTAQEKTSDAGFKVESNDGRLLRKVKFKDEKIKISDNNENINPFVLKRKGDKISVGTETVELGTVRSDGGSVKGKDADEATVFTSKYPSLSNAFAVLLLPGPPPEEKGILFAALLLRGQ